MLSGSDSSTTIHEALILPNKTLLYGKGKLIMRIKKTIVISVFCSMIFCAAGAVPVKKVFEVRFRMINAIHLVLPIGYIGAYSVPPFAKL